MNAGVRRPMRRAICLIGAAIVSGCALPPLVQPELPQDADTGTVIVYRGSQFRFDRVLFGEDGKPYLALNRTGHERKQVRVAAGTHRFEAWYYSDVGHEEWWQHATIDLRIGANTITCIKVSQRSFRFTPFTSIYEMSRVPCAPADRQAPNKALQPDVARPAGSSGR